MNNVLEDGIFRKDTTPRVPPPPDPRGSRVFTPRLGKDTEKATTVPSGRK
jgi:hypothetical protein